MHKDRWIGGGLIVVLVGLVSVGIWKTHRDRGARPENVVRRVGRLMGTTGTLAAIVPPGRRGEVEPLLREAEQTLRRVEAHMSTWLADSETGRLNAAPAGRHVPLSPDVLEVLGTARRAAAATEGAFDVTCRPLIELWRDAGRTGCEPTPDELTAARAASNWDLIELGHEGAVKRSASARVDLGGIAKGHAIDRAIDLLRRRGRLEGGMVDVGGDLACFGRSTSGEQWEVEVRAPFGPGVLARLRLPGGAVCTSGDYARFVEIGGRRYSHILDPRNGRPADVVCSITVVAPTAVVADIWATALSVLGTEGFSRLPAGVEALAVEGNRHSPRLRCTPGLCELLDEPLPEGLEVVHGPGKR